jgi:hypothetical protein
MAVDVDFVLQGCVSHEQSCQSILREILTLGDSRPSLLRLSNPEMNLHGCIALTDGRYVVGAQIVNTGETGYTALRKLL